MISNGMLAAIIVIVIIMLTGLLLNLCHCIARGVRGVSQSPGDDVQADDPHWILAAVGNTMYFVFCTVPCGLFCKARNETAVE